MQLQTKLKTLQEEVLKKGVDDLVATTKCCYCHRTLPDGAAHTKFCRNKTKDPRDEKHCLCAKAGRDCDESCTAYKNDRCVRNQKYRTNKEEQRKQKEKDNRLKRDQRKVVKKKKRNQVDPPVNIAKKKYEQQEEQAIADVNTDPPVNEEVTLSKFPESPDLQESEHMLDVV